MKHKKPSDIITEIATEYAQENRNMWDAISGEKPTPSTHDYLFAIMEYLDKQEKKVKK